MPLSISNSNSRIPEWNYKSFWAKIALITLLLGVGMELLFRRLGYSPIAVTDSISWCQRRGRLEDDGTGKQIAIIGPSFAETDLLLSVMEEELPGYSITKLAIGGLGGFRILEDIANRSRFHGLALCVVTPDFFLAQETPLIGQYHAFENNLGRYEQLCNRGIKTWVQEHAVLAVPPYKDLFRTIRYGQISPRLLQFFANGDVWVQYEEQPAAYKESVLAQNARTDTPLWWGQAADPAAWKDAFSCYRRYVEAIRSRGGNVVFFVPPTHPARWAYYQNQYPLDQYLGRIPQETGAELIRFWDFPEALNMASYDFSHLEKKDAVVVTHWVLNELRKRNLLPGDSSPLP